MVTDPEVEAIYNPLANGSHAPWSLADGVAMPTNSNDAVATAILIDECYDAIGIQRRPRSPRV